MPPNPFIQLLENPVPTLAWIGYLLLMLAVIAVAIPWAIRKSAWLIDRYYANRASDTWWSFGDRQNGYIPPAAWLWHLCWVIVTLAVAAWALGTVVWMVS